MSEALPTPKPRRVLAIDALRGLTIAAMVLVNNPGDWGIFENPEGAFWKALFWPMNHSAWHGLTPTDCIFPLFLFLSGVSCWFSFSRRAGTAGRLKKIAVRSLEIFLLGVFLVNFPFEDSAGAFFHKPFAEWRIMGVLQRIAVAWGLGALCVTLWEKRPRRIALAGAGVLLLHWIAMAFGGVAGEDPFSMYNNLGHRIDVALLGESHLWSLPTTWGAAAYEPEGLLGCLPAAVTMLIGWFAGRRIGLSGASGKSGRWLPVLSDLAAAGLALVAAGVLWNFAFPVNKALWTGSYVLVCGGLSCLLLGAAVWLFEELGTSRWNWVLVVFGCNATLLYALDAVWVKCSWFLPAPSGEGAFSAWLYQSVCAGIAGPQGGSFLYPCLHVGFYWLVLLFFYKRRIFLKL